MDSLLFECPFTNINAVRAVFFDKVQVPVDKLLARARVGDHAAEALRACPAAYRQKHLGVDSVCILDNFGQSGLHCPVVCKRR